ncbi:MAG TPA: CHAD domain-containing protein [Candidatus Binatia bacterium]|nr:CHAD domain-containing protein [Candidatus Binatia bacterium]
MSDSATGSADHAALQNRLLGLTRKRLEKFVSLLPKVLVSDHPDAIHDTRVWSRRLEQVFRVLFPKPRSAKSRKLVRTLRNVRRALGECRNIDVSIDLIQQKLDSGNSQTIREAWAQIQEHLRQKRAAEIERSREELTRHDIIAFVTRTQALLQSTELHNGPNGILKKGVAEALADWEEAFAAARESPEANQIHALRIAGKRLRYRAELLAELGETPFKSLAKSLKSLQNELGHWHDCLVLLQFVADFIGRPDFLVNHPELGRVLLTEMEKERHRNDSTLADVFESAEKIREWRARSAPED